MEYLSVSAAQQCVLNHMRLTGVESVSIYQALGRVLAEDVYANRDLPPYDVSAMDGFALRSADVAQAPASLQIIEDIKAGDRPQHALQAGQCARIMTGAPVPPGADTVIRVEDSEMQGETQVCIKLSVPAGNDIRRQGESMASGEIILNAGTEVTPGVLAVLATVKYLQLKVYQRPRVAIVSTGNELEAIDEPVDPYKIPDANSYALMAQLQAIGIAPDLLGIARDDPEQLRDYLQKGLQYDVLLVSGGTSVGVHDYVRPTLQALGVDMLFWRVNMKPGHPLAFGRTDGCVMFGLPGNPVSSMVCFEQYALPGLRRMMGHSRLFRRTLSARLTHDLKHRPGRVEFVRVTLGQDPHGYTATSTGLQGSGMLLSMARADALAVIPAAACGMAAGDEVVLQLLDGCELQAAAGLIE